MPSPTAPAGGNIAELPPTRYGSPPSRAQPALSLPCACSPPPSGPSVMSKLRLWSAGRLNPNESWGRSPSHWSRSNDASFRFMSACIMTAAAWTHPNDGWRAEDEGAGLAG